MRYRVKGGAIVLNLSGIPAKKENAKKSVKKTKLYAHTPKSVKKARAKAKAKKLNSIKYIPNMRYLK